MYPSHSEWSTKVYKTWRNIIYFWLVLCTLASHLYYLDLSFLIGKSFTQGLWGQIRYECIIRFDINVRCFCKIYVNHIFQVRPVRDRNIPRRVDKWKEYHPETYIQVPTVLPL